jgi:hypothetical protein
MEFARGFHPYLDDLSHGYQLNMVPSMAAKEAHLISSTLLLLLLLLLPQKKTLNPKP